MQYPDTYCSLEFIVLFLKSKPDEDEYKESAWKKLCEYLMEDTNVIIDEDEDNLDSKLLEDYPFIRILRDKKVGTETQLKAFHKNIDEINFQKERFSRSLFLVEYETERCEELQRKYGFLFLNYNNLMSNWKAIFDPEGIDTKEGSWLNKLAEGLCSYNAIIIFDRYFLAKPDEIHKFTEEILKCASKSIPADITTVVSEENPNFSQYCEGQLMKIRKITHANISVIMLDKNKFHDRELYTNSFYLLSGNSFKNIESTKAGSLLKLQSLLKTSSVMIERLRRLRDLVSEVENTEQQKRVFGSKENRLFLKLPLDK